LANNLSLTLDGKVIVLEWFYSANNRKHYYDEIISKDKQNRITTQVTPTKKPEPLTALVKFNFIKIVNLVYRGFIPKTIFFQ
jgi:hypothetical protein